MKFGEIPINGLGDVVFVDKCLMDGLSLDDHKRGNILFHVLHTVCIDPDKVIL